MFWPVKHPLSTPHYTLSSLCPSFKGKKLLSSLLPYLWLVLTPFFIMNVDGGYKYCDVTYCQFNILRQLRDKICTCRFYYYYYSNGFVRLRVKTVKPLYRNVLISFVSIMLFYVSLNCNETTYYEL